MALRGTSRRPNIGTTEGPCRSVNGSQAQVASRIHGTYALRSDLLASCVKIRENSVLDTRAQVQDGLPVRLDGFWPSGALDSGEVRPAVGVGLKRGTKLWIGRLGCKRLRCLFLLGVEGMPDLVSRSRKAVSDCSQAW